MFGRANENHHGPPERPSAGDTAKLKARLVQVIITDLRPMTFYLFINDEPISQLDVETLLLNIEAPADDGQGQEVVQASLSLNTPTAVAGLGVREVELFPGTVEVIGLGRRISVTCRTAGSLDGVWIDLGLRPDGTGAEVTGAQKLQIVLTQELLEAKLTWNDGRVDDLLPEPAEAE